MRIYKTKNYDEMSRKAANIISAQIILKPESVLGLATGSSPIGTYKQLIEWYNKGDLDFSQIRSINLDEYKGLPADNDQSYAYFMRHNLFDHVNIKSVNTFIPNGMEADVEKAIRDRVEDGTGNLYVLVNYTALFSTRNILKKLEGEHK